MSTNTPKTTQPDAQHGVTGNFYDLCLRLGRASGTPELMGVVWLCSPAGEIEAMRLFAEALGLQHAANRLETKEAVAAAALAGSYSQSPVPATEEGNA